MSSDAEVSAADKVAHNIASSLRNPLQKASATLDQVGKHYSFLASNQGRLHFEELVRKALRKHLEVEVLPGSLESGYVGTDSFRVTYMKHD